MHKTPRQGRQGITFLLLYTFCCMLTCAVLRNAIVHPKAITLAAEGVPLSAIAAFVTAAQAAGVDSMLFTVGAFGVEVAAARCAVAAILAVIVGLITMPSAASPASTAAAKAANATADANACASGCCDGDGDSAAVKKDNSTDDCCSDSAPASSTPSPPPTFVLRVFAALCSLFLEVVPWVGTGILFSAACNVLAPAGGLWCVSFPGHHLYAKHH